MMGGDYIVEVFITRDGRGTCPGDWLPVDGMDYSLRGQAVEVAAAWEADGYTTRIKKRRAA